MALPSIPIDDDNDSSLCDEQSVAANGVLYELIKKCFEL